MPVEGYIRGKPDAGWWEDQLAAGREYRKKYAYEAEWDKWRSYYRGNWRGDVMPLNLFFTLVRTIVPRIYFRNPAISIGPSKPGLEHMAFARVLERVDNKLIHQMNLKRELKRMVRDAFMFGTAWGKMGFGAQFTPTPGLDNQEPLGRSGERVEYRSNIFPNMPWFARIHPKDAIVPAGLENYEDTRWVAHDVTRPVDDIQSDPRFRNTRGLKSTMQMSKYGVQRRAISLATVTEIRDRKTQSVMVLAKEKEGDKVLFFGHDELQQFDLPIQPLIFNDDDEVFWGVPDSKILEPYQLEINETRTQQMKHRRLTLVRILAKLGAISDNEATKLVSEDVSPVIWMKKVQGSIRDNVHVMQGSTIPPELDRHAEMVMRDVRETVGFSRNSFGEFNPTSGDTTAFEASVVREATEIRVDERRDMVADYIVNIVETGIHPVIFKFWGPNQVVDVVGPGGVPIWVHFSGDALNTGKYAINVDPDSSIPQTRGVREAKAVKMYQILKENPLIDPVGLTQYLLHEMHGVQFDNLIRALPIPQNVPQGPIPPQQFGQMIGEGIQEAQKTQSIPSVAQIAGE